MTKNYIQNTYRPSYLQYFNKNNDIDLQNYIVSEYGENKLFVVRFYYIDTVKRFVVSKFTFHCCSLSYHQDKIKGVCEYSGLPT